MSLTEDRAFREAILEGNTVREISERHGTPTSTVQRRITSGARAFIDQVHLDLLTSHGSGELPAIALPNQAGDTLNRALDFTRWLTNELEDRGMQIRIHYRPLPSGDLVIAFSDRNPPPGSKAHPERLDDPEGNCSMPLPAIPTSLSEPLGAVRRRAADLRQERTDLMRQRDEARASMDRVTATTSDPNALVRTDEFRRAERLTQQLEENQQRLQAAEDEERYLLSRISGADQIGLRESFLSDPSALEELRVLAQSDQPFGTRLLGTVKSREAMVAEYEQRRNRMMAVAGDVVLPSDNARQTFVGVNQPLLRQIRLLDLLPTEVTDANTIDYVQEVYTAAAAETAELATKPNASVTLTDATAKAKTIAVWAGAARQTLSDVAGLSNSIQSLLHWDVEARLEAQILAGDGTGNNLLGITHTSGIGASLSATGDSVNADLVANAIRDVTLSNALPNAIVMNPTDVWRAMKVKAAGSGERLDGGGAFASAPTSMWGLPLIQTPVIAAGQALVGDFARGAVLYVREAINARTSDSDQSDFIQNRVKILVEGRFALAVMRPTAFSAVTLSFPN